MLQFIPKSNPVPYETFYRDNHDKIRQYIYGKIGNWQDAEDLTQESFLYAYHHYENYDPEKSSMNTWLYLIVNSRLKNHYRDAKTYVDLDELGEFLPDEGTPDMDECIYLEQMKSALLKALSTLAERERRIVIMSYFEGRTSDEIGQTLGLKAGNVRTIQSRAMNKLSALMKDFLI